MKALLIFLFLTNVNNTFAATNYIFSPEKGSVEFKTKGWPNLITIKGQGQGVTGELKEDDKKLSGKLLFQLDTLNTGIDLRDDHMKNKYLEVKKYPEASLTLTDVSLPKENDGEINFKAELSLHGTTKTVTGVAQLESENDTVKMTAEIPINLSDFKIETPSYKGITIAEKVNITFESSVIKQL